MLKEHGEACPHRLVECEWCEEILKWNGSLDTGASVLANRLFVAMLAATR